VEKKGEKSFEIGHMLGDLSNDLKDYGDCYIKRLLSAGPKNYGYEIIIRNPDGTQTSKIVRKLKGFTLDWKALEQASLESLKDLIDGRTASETIDQPDQILRTADLRLISKDGKKRLRYTFDKRVRAEDGSYLTWPWGTDHTAPETFVPLPNDYRPW
jgi:hypothetical protein